eukprot:CAMPEP_0116135368 /NCGR_PEP_ID=MMETSP0329-20121206/11152_1 /TAXON_ID=697910 /ORGANISM="Pseudo-nitzschia arenysensis, Strain B593" /LENGTH=509 /DNA_ID=CAMNT_0003630161 /DNA_START=3 /DNA_END=1532 /DNA_ORIENTATION=+
MESSLIELEATGLRISKLEEMAVFIYESMSISTRNYHSVQHVFDIINHDDRLENNPIAVIAACFHDCIYYHVDGGLTPVQAVLLEGSYAISGQTADEDANTFNAKREYKFYATENRGNKNQGKSMMLLQMVEVIFGYAPGQSIRITNDGLNEFLSAVVAVRMLQDHLPIEILAQIACCIEATIPFRQPDKETGKTHMDRLYENMKEAREIYNLELSDEDLVISVQRACLLSNSDVGNFGTTDRLYFLDNTWSLLPETNESLRNEYVYSVDHFHVALYKMYGFFGFLKPAVVFHEFRGVPAVPEMDRLIQECSNNLAFGRTYVGAKLVAMSLVSAVAVLTGGDAPISLFTGDLRASERRGSMLMEGSRASKRQKQDQFKLSGPVRSCDFFRNKTLHDSQQPPEEYLQNCTQPVYEILAEGRRSESSFDTKRSPWSALLYGYLGDEGLNRILEEQTLYPMNAERAWSLLRALPLKPVNTIVQSISQQALSRTEKICEVLSKLETEASTCSK